MKPSTQVDIDNQQYPDPLSVDFGSFEITEPPFQYPMDTSFMSKPFQIIQYFLDGSTSQDKPAQYDDIILTINNIAHKDLINVGDVAIIPTRKDILGFINKWKVTNNA